MGLRTCRQQEPYYRTSSQAPQEITGNLHNQTTVQSYNDFKNVLPPAENSLSPTKASFHGRGSLEADHSMTSSQRQVQVQLQPQHVSMPVPSKKTSRNKQTAASKDAE